MNTSRTSTRTLLLGLLAVIVVLFMGSSLWDLVSTTEFGESDFRIYWSAAYLLSRGENPYDMEAINTVQQTQTQAISNETIMAWNPPFLFLFLLPVAWLPFTAATFLWLVFNLFILITAAILLITLYLQNASARLKLAFLIFAIGFPAAITGLFMGQVTFLVFWGLVICMALIKKEQWFWAGASLLMTSIKPHIAVLAVLYLLIYMAHRRQYKGWLGLAAAALAGLGILLLFRSDLISNLVGETSVASGRWATSTIGGLFSYLQITEAARFLLLLFVPLPFYLAKHHERFSLEFSVALLTLITVPTTIFGWSYDQTILLIPIAQVFGWLTGSKYRLAIIACIVCVTIANYVQRVLPINEVFYVWVPLLWCFIFGLAWPKAPSPESRYA